MYKIRYWISAELMRWAVAILPDPYIKECMRWGINEAIRLMMKNDGPKD